MRQAHSTTEGRRKGKHLTYADRVPIRGVSKTEGRSFRGRELNCFPDAARNEIKRGSVTLYKGGTKLKLPRRAARNAVNAAGVVVTSWRNPNSLLLSSGVAFFTLSDVSLHFT